MISLNYGESRPIYEQIRDGLRRLIETGALAEGERLPSVRSLAASLAINPNTIQRAYNELEGEGYIHSVPGKGSFAAPRSAFASGRQARLFHELEHIAAQLRLLGLDDDAICLRIRNGGPGQNGTKEEAKL